MTPPSRRPADDPSAVDPSIAGQYDGGPPGHGVSLLPGSIPLHGKFARYASRLYRCRQYPISAPDEDVQQLSLLTEHGDPPDAEWKRAPEYPGGPVWWTKVVSLTEVEETFRSAGSARWHGVELGALTYLTEENLLGGYFSLPRETLPPGLDRMRYLVRVDRFVWHAHIPLDEVEQLEITRSPWPVRPKRRRLFGR